MSYMNVLKYSVQLPPMNCRIELSSNENQSYTSGDSITGKLFLSCEKDLYSFGIKVVLEGKAIVKFNEQGTQSTTKTLLEKFVYVYGKGKQKICLLSGEHIFPFILDIPRSSLLPGSFRSPFGFILYQIVGYVELEANKLVKKSEKTITIAGYLNLAQNPKLALPMCYEKTEKRSRKSIPQFKFNFRMPQSFYLAGESIPFELEVDNPSAYEISSLVVSFIQKITYRIRTGLATTKHKIITRMETGNMDGPNGTTWTEAILVPDGTLPNQEGIIEIIYTLKIEVRTSGSEASLNGEVPITIGTSRDSLSTQKVGKNSMRPSWSRGERLSSPLMGLRSSRTLSRASSGRMSQPSLPNYSLSSLRSRAASVDALPPTFEDYLKDGKSAEM